MAENQPSMAELREATNAAMASEVPYAITPEPEAKPEEPLADEPVLTIETAPTEPAGSKAPEIPQGLKDVFTDTPFTGEDLVKNVQDAVKSWKSTSGEYAKIKEKVKPYEQLLEDASRDSNLANAIRQLELLYRNPQLADAYVTPKGQLDARPNPVQYNATDPESGQQYFDQARYDKDLEGYLSRQLDSRINSRLSQMEQQQKANDEKAKLRQVFPDANPDEVLERVKQRGTNWTLTDAYKALEFDNMKAKITEEVRKELTNKLDTANKTTSPTATGTSKQTVNVADVVAYIAKHGGESAKKKYGNEIFFKALRQGTEAIE